MLIVIQTCNVSERHKETWDQNPSTNQSNRCQGLVMGKKDTVKVQHRIDVELCFLPISFKAKLLGRCPGMGFYSLFVRGMLTAPKTPHVLCPPPLGCLTGSVHSLGLCLFAGPWFCISGSAGAAPASAGCALPARAACTENTLRFGEGA